MAWLLNRLSPSSAVCIRPSEGAMGYESTRIGCFMGRRNQNREPYRVNKLKSAKMMSETPNPCQGPSTDQRPGRYHHPSAAAAPGDPGPLAVLTSSGYGSKNPSICRPPNGILSRHFSLISNPRNHDKKRNPSLHKHVPSLSCDCSVVHHGSSTDE